MATRLEKHKERQAQLNALGRSIARRAKSKCELCSGTQSLTLTEVPPIQDTPVIEQSILVCTQCKQGLESKVIMDDPHWVYLHEMVWSEVPVVQVCALWLATKLSQQGVHWATQVIDGIYMEPEIEVWLNSLSN